MNNRIQEISDLRSAVERYKEGGYCGFQITMALAEGIISEYDRLQAEVKKQTELKLETYRANTEWQEQNRILQEETKGMKDALNLDLSIVELQSPTRMEQINAILSHLKG